MYKIFLFLIIFIVLIYFSKNIEPYQVNIDATRYPNNFCECIDLWTTLIKAGKRSNDVYIKGIFLRKFSMYVYFFSIISWRNIWLTITQRSKTSLYNLSIG